MNAEEKKGYQAAIDALKKQLSGKGGSGNLQIPSGGGGKQQQGSAGASNGGGSQSAGGAASKMQAPTLNAADQKKADAAAAAAAKNGNGKSQASEQTRKNAAEASVSVGGFISQEDGAAIARSEGYDESDCKVKPTAAVQQDWKDATIEACSKNNSPGKGFIVSRFKDYYITSHDWKSDLRKYMGRALSSMDFDTRLGKKKWLAQGEIKKYDVPQHCLLDSVIFLIDCSGSVSDKLLQNIISECYTICKKKKIEKVTYCYYDDGIRQMETNMPMKTDGILNPDMVKRIRRGNTRPAAEIHGRGGNEEDTVMGEITKMIKKSHNKPELVMWFTDGYTYARPVKPSCIKHMIWVVYDNNNFEVKDNSRVIHIKSEDLGS